MAKHLEETPSLELPNGLPASPGTDFYTLLGILTNKAWLIALCVVVAGIGAAYKVKHDPRIYQATATVQVEQEEQKVVKVEQVLREDLRGQDILNTIAQKLRNRVLLERVLETNRLAQNPEFTSPRPPAQANKDQLVSRLEGLVKTTLRRNTRLIDIAVSHTSPRLAALIANSVVGEYLNQDSYMRSSTTKGAYEFLKEESERLKKKLETSEQALQAYRQEVGSISLQQSQDIVIPQLRELNIRLIAARTETLRLQAPYENLRQTRPLVEALLGQAQIASDPEVIAARTTVLRLENEFAALGLRYKPKHPKYGQAAAQLEEWRRTYTNAVFRVAATTLEGCRAAYENARAMESGLEKAFHETETAALKLSQQAIRFSILSREMEADSALFNTVLNRLKETSITTDFQPERIRLIQPATEPERPVSPNVRVIFSLAVLGGLLAGVLLALGLNTLDTSLKSVDEAEDYLQLPVLSTVPRLREIKTTHNQMVAAEGAGSVGAEAFRTLRTSISLLGRTELRRSFLFTSAVPQEGKSFSSLNCAVSMAQQGLRTLLIDADLRRPNIEEYLTGNTDHHPGVTDFLLGNKKLDDIVYPVEQVPNLAYIPAGTNVPNPAELLAQGEIKPLLENALTHYDRVVIDSAPIHPVSDTLSLARHAHATVLVVHGGRTPRQPVARAIQLLHNAGATMGGILLNMLPRSRHGGYYYNYYYHDYYGHYGHYGHAPDTRKKPAPPPTTP